MHSQNGHAILTDKEKKMYAVVFNANVWLGFCFLVLLIIQALFPQMLIVKLLAAFASVVVFAGTAAILASWKNDFLKNSKKDHPFLMTLLNLFGLCIQISILIGLPIVRALHWIFDLDYPIAMNLVSLIMFWIYGTLTLIAFIRKIKRMIFNKPFPAPIGYRSLTSPHQTVLMLWSLAWLAMTTYALYSYLHIAQRIHQL